MKEKLAKLIDVKSLMTLALTAGFIGLTCSGEVSGQEYMSIFTMIVGFYFGTQAEKAQKLGHPEMTVDPECTCDVGCTGPAKEGKGNTPVGPGAETKKPGPADECK